MLNIFFLPFHPLLLKRLLRYSNATVEIFRGLHQNLWVNPRYFNRKSLRSMTRIAPSTSNKKAQGRPFRFPTAVVDPGSSATDADGGEAPGARGKPCRNPQKWHPHACQSDFLKALSSFFAGAIRRSRMLAADGSGKKSGFLLLVNSELNPAGERSDFRFLSPQVFEKTIKAFQPFKKHACFNL